MIIELYLKEIEEKLPKIVFFCAKHMLEKVYNTEKDSIKEDELKDFFIDYNNYEKLLNDYANVIYNRFESSKEEVYESLCEYFNEENDNKYLFLHRLKRISNQEPTKYLSFEDPDMRDAAILRVYDKIDTIEASKYYKEHKDLASKELSKLKKSLDLVKRAVGMV